MNHKEMSSHWELLISRSLTELMPKQSSKEHYAGDECWCIPNRMKIRHAEDESAILRVWVHAAGSIEISEDLIAAIDAVCRYWDKTRV